MLGMGVIALGIDAPARLIHIATANSWLRAKT